MMRNKFRFLLIIGLATLLVSCGVILNILSPCPPARLADALEPNDNLDLATPLNQKLEANLNPKEIDVYRFEVSANQHYTLNAFIIQGNGNDEAGLNLLLEGPNNFRLTLRNGVNELVLATAGTYFLTVTDGSRPYPDCIVCTCTGRGPQYSLELKQ